MMRIGRRIIQAGVKAGSPQSSAHAWAVSGCFGLVNNGDAMSNTATYTVKPPQTIT
jgi:hypothetical protein